MLLTFQDRLRIPWRGGAKQVRFKKKRNPFIRQCSQNLQLLFLLSDILGSYHSDDTLAVVTVCSCFKRVLLYCDMFGHSIVFGLLLLLFEESFPKVIDLCALEPSDITTYSYCRTKFFFLWSFWSVAYLWILFESTVPLMELLPEENAALVLMISLAIFCFYKV